MIYHENTINEKESYVKYIEDVNKLCSNGNPTYDNICIPVSYLTAQTITGEEIYEGNPGYDIISKVISAISAVFLSYYYDKKYLLEDEFSSNVNDLDIQNPDKKRFISIHTEFLIMCNSYKFIRTLIFTKCHTLDDFNTFFNGNYAVLKILCDMTFYIYQDCLGCPENLSGVMDVFYNNQEDIKKYLYF